MHEALLSVPERQLQAIPNEFTYRQQCLYNKALREQGPMN